MKISDQAIKEFQDLWLAQFGRLIPAHEAKIYAEDLVSMLKFFHKPLSQPKGQDPPKDKGPP
jgi:hypothetical protein